jgi:hypothetical protein
MRSVGTVATDAPAKPILPVLSDDFIEAVHNGERLSALERIQVIILVRDHYGNVGVM